MKNYVLNGKVASKANHVANLILLGGSTVSASALCFFLYYYTWTGQRQFTSTAAAAMHYAAMASVSVVLFASLWLRPAYKIGLALLCVSVTGAVYQVEFFLARSNDDLGGHTVPFWGFNAASAERRQVFARFASRFGVKVDTRAGSEVVADLRSRGADAVPPIMLGRIVSSQGSLKIAAPERVVDLMPMGGLADKLTILCNESGQYVTYQSDEHGFRNPRGIWKSSHADIAALGESFIQGYCVADGQTFVDLLRKRYPVTLNLGMSGESALLQLGAIKEYLPRYAPKITLWFFCERIDLYDINDESKQPLLLRYLDPAFSQHLLERQTEIDRALQVFVTDSDKRDSEVKPPLKPGPFEKWLEILKLSNIRSRSNLVYGMNAEEGTNLSVLKQAKNNILTASLTQAKALVSSWGGTLYFVYLPSWERYGRDARLAEIERTATLKLVSALEIPIIDVEPAFHAQRDPLALFPMRTFGHYNEEGNRLVADTILKSLPEPRIRGEVSSTFKGPAVTIGVNNRSSH